MERSKGISDWYEGRSVLVTGGTGFMGKVLVEKLLRSCPRLQAIYILIRPKRGLRAKDRLHQLLSLSIFDEVRKTPVLLDKVHAIESDVTLPALGLSLEDQGVLREQVSVIFHSAATVKFDEPLKDAVAINMAATRSVIHLAQSMSKLEVMIHVSTAYCNCDKLDVSEQVYPIDRDPVKVIRAVEALDEELLETVTPRLLGNKPNTYTFTKALAEQIVYGQSGILPIAIVRPSIVVAGWKEPIPGWVDNLNGPTGMLVGAGKGVLRTMLCEKNYIADLIPVDIAINFCIAAAWYTATSRPNNIMVYHCTTGKGNPIRWRDLKAWGYDAVLKYPSQDVMWYPGGSFKNNHLLNFLANILFQRVPAHLIDLSARITGNKPIMVRIQDKLFKACKTLEFFTMREFLFNNDNMMGVWETLSPQDKETFYFDVNSLDWKAYIDTYVLGARAFILKEDPATIPEARRSLMRMYILHKLTEIGFFVTFFWLLFRKSHVAKRMLFTFLGIITAAVRHVRLPMLQ